MKSYAALGNELDQLDKEIAEIEAEAARLPDLQEKRAQLVSEMNRKLGGLSPDPAESEDASSLSQEDKREEHDQKEAVQQAQKIDGAEACETVDKEGLVPAEVAESLGLSGLRKEADGSTRFGAFKI